MDTDQESAIKAVLAAEAHVQDLIEVFLKTQADFAAHPDEAHNAHMQVARIALAFASAGATTARHELDNKNYTLAIFASREVISLLRHARAATQKRLVDDDDALV